MPLPSGLQSFWREISWPLYGHSLISNSFSPAALRLLALCLIFAILSTMCLYVGSVWLHLVWGPLCFLYLNVCLLLHIWSLLAIISSFHIFNLFLLLGVCSLLAHIISLSSELLSPVWLLPFGSLSKPLLLHPLEAGLHQDVSCFGSALSEHWACYPTLYRISLITSKYNNPGPI